MLTYKPKAEKNQGIAEDKPYKPCIYVPIDKAWAKHLAVGEEVEVTVKGKLTGISVREREGYSHSEMDVEIKEISIPETNEFAKMSEDD